MTPPEGDLFTGLARAAIERIRDGVALLPGFASDPAIAAAVRTILAAAPPRRMTTPGGLAGMLDGRQDECEQYRDDGDDCQQFDHRPPVRRRVFFAVGISS